MLLFHLPKGSWNILQNMRNSESICYITLGTVQQVLVVAGFQVQYDQYFPSFPDFADLFHEPLDKCSL